ncbi:MAG: MerR family transcriptional regulator [Bacteroidetes bacterium]|nr:MerR family transcriptional regulator [Bacteroidota bacterium]
MKDNTSKIYYPIKEVSELLDVSYSYLRYIEKEVPDFQVKKNDKLTRFYTLENINYIKQFIQLTKVEGHSISYAAEKLKKEGGRIYKKAEMLDELKNIKSFLQKLQKEINQPKKENDF